MSLWQATSEAEAEVVVEEDVEHEEEPHAVVVEATLAVLVKHQR